MEFTPPPAGPCVPVSNTGLQASDPQLFWTPERRKIHKEQDQLRRVNAALADYSTLEILKALSDRRDFMAADRVFTEWLDGNF